MARLAVAAGVPIVPVGTIGTQKVQPIGQPYPTLRRNAVTIKYGKPIDTEGRPALVDALTTEFPAITCGYVPARANDDWSWVAGRLRLGLDYLRYQHPLYADTPKLTDLARERTPGLFVRVGDWIRGSAQWARRPATAIARRFERAIPEDETIRAQELFITSTTREITWVARWNDKYIGQAKCGPVTVKLHRALQQRVRRETVTA